VLAIWNGDVGRFGRRENAEPVLKNFLYHFVELIFGPTADLRQARGEKPPRNPLTKNLGQDSQISGDLFTV
jgi:hypothetical protein